MNDNTFFLIIGGVFIGELLLLIILLWKEILSFLFPGDYAYTAIKEKDLNVKTDIRAKGMNSQFEFKNMKYNMFYPPESTIKPLKKGRLTYFYYEEGNSNPIDLNTNQKYDSSNMDESIKKNEFENLFTEKFTWNDFLSKNLMIIIIIGVLVIIVLVLLFKQNPQQVPVPAQSLQP